MQEAPSLTENLIIVDTAAGVLDLTEYIKDKEYVIFDTETTGVTKYDQIIGYSVCAEETIAYYVILSKYDTISQTLLPLNTINNSIKLMETLKTKKLVMHNSVFDCMIVESFFKVSLIESVHTDTMILAHLLDENRRVGLKELASEIFGQHSTEEQAAMKASVLANGGQLTKKTYEMYKADPQLMARYGAKDAILTYKLFNHLVPILVAEQLDEFFYDDESMPLLKNCTYDLNTIGLHVDTSRLSQLKKTLKGEMAEAKDFIYQEIDVQIKDKYPGTTKKNTFNIGSSQQLSWLIFGKMALEFGNLTKEGKTVCKSLGFPSLPYTNASRKAFIQQCTTLAGKEYYPAGGQPKKIKEPWAYIACDKATLKKLSSKYKWIEKLLEYQRKSKLLSTYVEGIESRMKYGVIQPSFLQHGTTSGRYSSRNPNFQNLPRDDKRIKECIVARPGKVFVGADYSQLEPRVFAFFSADKRLLNAFKGTDDFYSVIGMEVYDKKDCTPKKEGSEDAFGIKYKKLRDLSKVIALASTYGATARQLAPTTGKSPEDTQKDIDSYFAKFPGVKQMMLNAHNTVRKHGKVLNYFGRPRRMPEALSMPKGRHEDLPYNFRNILNLAVNHTIQSTGASIVNRAAIQFKKYAQEAQIDAKIVIQVHDSLVIECDKLLAEDVSVLLQDAMENTIQLEGIKLEAVPKIGHNLSEV